MHATKDSETCIRRGQCLPLGSQSVWASFSEVGTRPIVMAMANMDSNALFHNQAVGAESTVSGLVALIASANAIRLVNKAKFTSDIVFAFWAGESWGYLGSRKFVQDIQNFKCESGDGNSCSTPYKSSLAFEKIKLDQISAIVELNQIGNSHKLYIHEENTYANNLANTLLTVSNASTTVSFERVDNAAHNLPGIPPSSLMPFLQAKPDLPGVVITDYISTYTNQFYHTHLDDGIQDPLDYNQVCDASTLVARSLYVLATGVSPTSPEVLAISSNCSLVRTLLRCLTTDFTCLYVSSYLYPLDLPQTASYYPSVYGYSSQQQLVTLPIKFVHDFVAVITRNLTNTTCQRSSDCETGMSCTSGWCRREDAYYHDAISPGIDWDTKNSKWIVTDSKQPLWTESNWDATRLRLFLQDSPTHEGVFLAFGILEFLGSFVIIYFCKRYFLRNFKIL